MSPRLFITFEGIDGSGKTTQIELLQKKMSESGYEYTFIREPGSTAIGEKIRQILLSPESKEMHLATEVMLYTAARAQLVHEVINPALEEEQAVICDRYIHSTLAYQGYGLGYDLEQIRTLNREAMGGTWPDLTFVLDLDVEESFQRCSQKHQAEGQGKDRIEQRSFEFYHRVREGYLAMAKADPQRMVVIPPHLNVEEAHQKIWGIIHDKIGSGL